MTTGAPLVLLVSSGQQLYREYLLSQLSGAFAVWLITDESVDWQAPYLTGTTRVAALDHEQVLAAARDVQAQRPVAGLLSWDERYIIVTADVADTLGLPGASPAGVRACRDKAASRDILRAAGLPQPDSRYCLTPDEAVTFAGRVGYPVVVKPRGMGASIGVARADSDADLRLRFQEAADSSLQGAAAFQHGALVETFLTGPEISVDGRVVAGQFEALWVARKSVGLPPHFEETGHVVDAADPLLTDPGLQDVLQRAHTAAGFQDGMTHTELKLTPAGPVIVEINGRLGGDLIPHLATLATGLRPGQLAGEVATRRAGEATRTVCQSAAIAFRYPDADLTVDRVTLPELALPEDYAGQCVALAAPGAALGLPPSAFVGRAAYAVVTGPDAQTCRALSETLAQAVTVQARLSAPELAPV